MSFCLMGCGQVREWLDVGNPSIKPELKIVRHEVFCLFVVFLFVFAVSIFLITKFVLSSFTCITYVIHVNE